MRRLRNWTYKNITAFLKENGFSFSEQLEGSHERWIKPAAPDTPEKRVEVNFTHASYPVKTLETMIKQSGIPKSEWVNWAGS